MNGKLLEENNLQDAYACTYKDMYWLCLNGVAYILDGLQPLQTDKSMPYATRQYAGFYRTNIPARIIWTYDGKLYFGTADGKIKEFHQDPDSLTSYNDDGVAIKAVWETPDFCGKSFYKNKTFRYMAIRLATALKTSVKMYVRKKGIWSFVKEEKNKTRYFSFANVIFSALTFRTNMSPATVPTKIKVKKVDTARFRFENDELNEPFGLYDIAFEYIENGYYKG